MFVINSDSPVFIEYVFSLTDEKACVYFYFSDDKDNCSKFFRIFHSSANDNQNYNYYVTKSHQL